MHVVKLIKEPHQVNTGAHSHNSFRQAGDLPLHLADEGLDTDTVIVLEQDGLTSQTTQPMLHSGASYF